MTRTITFLTLFLNISLNAQDFAFRQFSMKEGLSQMKCTSIARDSLGYIWIGTRSGLNRFDGENFEVFTIDDGLLHNRIIDIEIYSNGQIVIATAGGINVFNGNSFTAHPVNLPSVMYQGYLNSEEDYILNETDGNRYIIFNGDKAVIKEIAIQRSTLIKDNKNNLLFIDVEQKVYDFKSMNHLHSIEDNNVIQNYWVENLNVIIDRQNMVSVINKEAIVKVEAKEYLKKYPISSIFNSTLLKHQKNSPQPWPIFQDFEKNVIHPIDFIEEEDGSIWVASESGLFHISQPGIKHFNSHEAPYVWSVIEDKNQKIYMSSYGYGLKEWDGKDLKNTERNCEPHFKTFLTGSALLNGKPIFTAIHSVASLDSNYRIEDKIIHEIKYDSLNKIYILGTFNGIVSTKDFASFDFYDENSGIHSNNYIQSITIDNDGMYWLSSYQGVSKFNPKTKKAVAYTQEDKNLSAQSVFYTFQDKYGTIWIGTDTGLQKYNKTTDTFTPVNSNLISKNVKCIAEYDSNQIMVACKDGIYLMDINKYHNKEILDIKLINEAVGFTGVEPGFNCLYKDSKNNIWITSATDLSFMNADSLIITKQELKPHLISINGRRLPFEKKDSIFNPDFSNNLLTLQCNAIGTYRPNKVKFSYKQDNKPWTEWQEEFNLNLTELDNGKHIIKIVAGPSDINKDDLIYDQLVFNIYLPIYKRSWFIPTLILSTICILIWAFYNYIKEKIAQKNFKKQLLELKYFRNQLLLSEMNPHFIFNVMASIHNKILKGKKEEASESLLNLSTLIRNFLQASHKSNNIQSGYDSDHSLKKELELLRQFVDFERTKSNNYFNYNFIIHENLNEENYFLPPMLIQPFVENAIKHGLLMSDVKGNLEIKFSNYKNTLKCVIKDDGIGRKKSAEIYKGQKKLHKSLAISIIKERIVILNQIGHNIDLSIEDGVPSGTEVTLSFEQEH